MATESELHDLAREALASIVRVSDPDEAEEVRLRYLGRKGGILTEVTRGLKNLAPDQKRILGPIANRLKGLIENALSAHKRGDMAAVGEAVQSQIEQKDGKDFLFGLIELPADFLNLQGSGAIAGQIVDLTVPGRTPPLGHKHPIVQTMEDIIEVLTRLGYTVAEGPEIELEHYNFEALNIPRDHPARDMQDTFYVSDDVLLRTHTSPVQIRVMEKQQPPVKIIAPGKVFRCDADVTHSPMFHQIEGLYVDEGVSFADLEPSAEVDIACDHLAGGKWLEVLGAGMVDPAVFEAVGYDPEKWSGFAWGLGVERVAMLRYGISDIRKFFENDLRMLRQF